MKIKISFICVCLLSMLMAVSCGKKKAFREEDGQSTIDNRETQGENDAAVADVNDVIGNQGKLHGKGTGTTGELSITGNVCGLSIDTAGLPQGSVKLNYNGTSCHNRTRTGTIVISIQNYAAGKRWRDKGCVLKLEYLNYKIVRTSDKKSVEFNGVQYLTNESGGTWWELLIAKTQASLVHAISGNDLLATFDDGKTASYNINRRITYSLPGGVITCMVEGTGNSDGLSNLENYGSTRNGEAFTSQVITPIVWNITCGARAPVQGEVNLKVKSKEFDLKCTFAVDANGNPMSVGANDCAYGWKIEWTYKKKSKKKVRGYN